ncbi:protein MTSS 1-like isoform X1 [Phyllopteryx taeniolatus]|uniref:protein MTSS 1-like isoform X1 n=2 Tax=Phyllopteryx taeniolatus TaxID=161469 RepID=UPI002AD335AE|nr:protein MTSS 1-like isoform X1 [Phyllopteryx taeniolatus]XP_061616242.1 protein MTSS 1-like isoform X1 [Phyllopteryx taeniolatus]
METMERECSALGGLFQNVIADMKGSYPVWEDFVSKASKLQSQLRTTVVAAAAFLDAFQKVADMATSSRGATRDIGSALTRMCMRHRSIEAKLRQFSTLFVDCLINPLQEQMEEWKRVANTLDKDHAKEYKKARQEIKKRSSDTLKLQKKAKKADIFGRGDIQPQLDNAKQEVSDKYFLLEEAEKQAVRRAMVEERSRFCCVVAMLRPVVEEEMSMLGEISHLQTLTDDLKMLTMDPHKLPAASEQVIVDLKASECTWSYQTPPSSPSTTVSRKSSMCSSLNSVNSSDSRSSGSRCHSPTSHFRYRTSSSSSSALPQQTPARLSSVSSHDSGFISQDASRSKSPSPMPPDPSQLSDGLDRHAHPWLCGVLQQDIHFHSPYFLSSSSSSSTATSPLSPPSPSTLSPVRSSRLADFPPFCSSATSSSSRVPSWKDWAKPGPYDQTVFNALRKGKERREAVDPQGEELQGGKGSPPVSSPKEDREAHVELARALARSLHLDFHGSSRDSLQGSSGYSSQTNTPCCSEDAGPTQDCDYFSMAADHEGDRQNPDVDKSPGVPRPSDLSQSCRRLFQSKRPASACVLPGPAAVVPPGVATIRRTPSSKPNLRRPSGGLALGPIPIKPPMIPVKTPTVPVHAGFPRGTTSEDGNTPRNPVSPPSTPLSPGSSGTFSPHFDRGRGSEPDRRPLPELLEETEHGDGADDFLVAIRRGVKLKRTTTDDRSAPRIH